MHVLTTSQLASKANVNIATIRFYERKGLLQEPPRRTSGYRQYPADAVRRIRFIKHAQELGFSLREVRELLELKLGAASACADVLARAEAKRADVEKKLATLERLRCILTDLIAACGDRAPTAPASECPILEALDADDRWLGDDLA